MEQRQCIPIKIELCGVIFEVRDINVPGPSLKNHTYGNYVPYCLKPHHRPQNLFEALYGTTAMHSNRN